MTDKQVSPEHPGASKNVIYDRAREGECEEQAMARAILEPAIRNAATAMIFSSSLIERTDTLPPTMAYVEHIKSELARSERGDVGIASRVLTAQAIALDSMFSEFSRRSAVNMGSHLDAAERYARLAFKAQSNCRTTLEALAKLHQPREQTVRHVHVNDGGQAIVADQVNHYSGGPGIGETVKQCHATGTTDEGCPVPCSDAARR